MAIRLNLEGEETAVEVVMGLNRTRLASAKSTTVPCARLINLISFAV